MRAYTEPNIIGKSAYGSERSKRIACGCAASMFWIRLNRLRPIDAVAGLSRRLIVNSTSLDVNSRP